jgi:hypothetical protein
MVRRLSTRRKSISSVFEVVFVPGTVFTGDSDLYEMLLASIPWMRTMRSRSWRADIGMSQKLCICWLRVERTFGSLRHCVEADLFAMTESRWEMSQMSRVGIQSGLDSILRWAH